MAIKIMLIFVAEGGGESASDQHLDGYSGAKMIAFGRRPA